jgi:hypothetical protein
MRPSFSPSVYIRDLKTGTTRMLSRIGDAQAAGNLFFGWQSVSYDGRYVVFSTGALGLDPPNTSEVAHVYEFLDAPSVLTLRAVARSARHGIPTRARRSSSRSPPVRGSASLRATILPSLPGGAGVNSLT